MSTNIPSNQLVLIETPFLCYISGEVPGLYSPEELEPLLSPLKDLASQDGFTGPLYNYFSSSQYCIFISSSLTLMLYFNFYYFIILVCFQICICGAAVLYCVIAIHCPLFYDCVRLHSSALLLCRAMCAAKVVQCH